MGAQYARHIKYGWPGGMESSDNDFYYDQDTQTLHVPNITADSQSFSGELVTSPTLTGTILLGSTGSDTVTVNATTTVATVLTFGTTTKLQFRDTGLFIHSNTDGKILYSSDGSGADDHTFSGTVTFSDAVQNNAIITVGVDGTGYDVLLYGATSGKSWLWDESADKMIVTGASQFSGDIIVGIDDTGYDVTFFGATSGKYCKWDQANDDLELVGTLTQTGNAAITGTLGVTGATTVTSASASALTVGRLGATTPVLKVNAATSTVVTGLEITGAAAAAGLAVAVISSGTNENLTVDAKGSGTISLGANSTGAIVLGRATGVTGALTVTSAGAAALAVGTNGATNPAFSVDSSTGSMAAGFKVTGATAAWTVALVVTSSGADASLTLNAKGSGTIGIGTVSTGAVTITPATTITGALTNTGATYANGGVDRSTAAALAIGATNATSVVITPATTITGAATHSSTTALVGVTTVTAIAGIVSALATTNQRIVPFFGAGVQDTPAPTAAIPLTNYYSTLNSTAGATTQTLAASTIVGQVKKIQMIVDGGDDVVTVTSLSGGTTITFADVGDTAELMWNGTAWIAIALYNCADGATAPVLA